MYSYDHDEIDRLQRIIDGKPPRREITLPADALMTKEELTKSLKEAWDRAVRKSRK